MKTVFLFLFVITVGCSKYHETSRITGTWRGVQVYTYEQRVVADSAQDLVALLGEIVTSTEVV